MEIALKKQVQVEISYEVYPGTKIKLYIFGSSSTLVKGEIGKALDLYHRFNLVNLWYCELISWSCF